MIRNLALLILLSFGIQSLQAQIAVGQWREHLPYNELIAITDAGNKVFAATPYSLFSVDKNERSIDRLSKVNGLSDVNLSALSYHKPSATLVVGYENGNIDLVRNGSVINVSDIKRKNIIGGKQINCFHFIDDIAYIATQFGIVVYDMSRLEVKDTWYIGPNGDYLNIHDFQSNDTAFFVASEEGFYSAPLQGVNHAFFGSWQRDDRLPVPDQNYNTFCFYKDQIYLNYASAVYGMDTLYVLDNGAWDYVDTTNLADVFRLRAYGDTLLIVSRSYRYLYNDLQTEFPIYTYNQTGWPTAPDARDAFFEPNGHLWTADARYGMAWSPQQWTYELIVPDGPAYINSHAMDCKSGALWVVSGGVIDTWNNSYENKGFYRFTDEKWSSYNMGNMPVFDSITDILTVAIDPSDKNHAFIGSWGEGVIEVKDGGVVAVYDQNNSTLSEAGNRPGYVGVGGMAYDDEGNLWMTNTANSQGLVVYKRDKTWKSLSLMPHITEDVLSTLVIDEWDQKWMIVPRGGGIVVFNQGDDIDNTLDDQVAKITSAVGKGALPSNDVRSIAVDRDNEIWIGTVEGVAVIYSPENVFNSGYSHDAQQIYVEQAGISQYLLQSEVVTAIAVDGANNKWFGTANAGVFYMSDDGTEQIYHFTEDNSPLLSNNIISICIDHKSGEVFFGTEKGLISFRGHATKGAETHENVTVFPNPVRPNYDGYITVSGLVEDANVKITDIAGHLVFETEALGGQVVWDGRTPEGEKVSTGVYLVFSSNNDGSQTAVAKILFIK